MHSHASDYIDSSFEIDSNEDETVRRVPAKILGNKEEEDKDTGATTEEILHPITSASPPLHPPTQALAPSALRTLRPTLSRLPSEIAELAANVQSPFKEAMLKALTNLEPEYLLRVEARWFPPPKPEIGLCILWMLHLSLIHI